jgi:hypothetical protein
VKATAISLWFISINLMAIAGWLQMGYPWVRFIAVQLLQFEAMVAGWFLLIPFCLSYAWRTVPSSLDPKRTIDEWEFPPMNFAFSNREDGVSGRYALVWTSDGRQVPYLPNAWAPLRAYLWSGWRNSADALKYRFAWKGGPFRRWEWRGYHLQFGWNGSGFPVISLGR